MPDSFDRGREMFNRRGAFSRFKNLLDRQDMHERWHDYERVAEENALRDWCADNGITLSD